MKLPIRTLSCRLLLTLFLTSFFVAGSIFADAAFISAKSANLILADAPFTANATLLGTVELAWGSLGTFEDTLTVPTEEELSALPDLGELEIMFLLKKAPNDAVTGYVDLTQTLVFTGQHAISATVGSEVSMLIVGPQVDGTYKDGQLNLRSERFTYTTESGQTVQRQFRLTANAVQEPNLLSGEYRETIWGFGLKPLTIVGSFRLKDLNALPVDVNRAPVANVQLVKTAQNSAKAITLAGSDADGDILTFTINAGPINGTLSGTAPNVTYTPKAGFAGSDSFTFSVNDGKVDSDAVAIKITVEGVPNHPPTAGADTATTSAGKAVTINVLANDADPDGDPLTVTITQQPQNGSAVVSGVTIVYTPNVDFSGADSLTYTVTDSKGATAGATITITVGPRVEGATIYLPLVNK